MNFIRLTVEDGLSQSWVLAICQDRYGFIWIGTDDGLNRYDGHNFQVYKNNSRNNHTISNNSISSLLEDSKGNLWVGTVEGLNCYDRQHDRFIRHAKWPQRIIKSIVEDELHNLWIGTNNYLYYYNCKTDSFFVFKPQNNLQGIGQKDIGYISSGYITTIYVDSKRNIWIGSNCGLNLYNKEKNVFINYYHKGNNPQSLGNDYVRSILEDKTGRLWIGTNAGLDLFINAKDRPQKGVFTHYQNDARNNQSITNGAVLSLLEDCNHNLWIGTENGGLDMLDLRNFSEGSCSFIHFRNEPNKIKSLSDNSIYSLFQDKQSNIWIGTYGKGINIFSRAANKFIHFTSEPLNKNSLSNNHVNTFLEENDFIWIGTEGGLNQYNKKDRTFKRFVHNPLDKTSIGSNAVWAIYKDKQGNLWIGTWAGGLNKFNYKTQTFTHYYSNPKDPNSLSSNNIFSIKEDNQGYLWIGTMGGGLNRFERKHETFTSYQTINSEINADYVVSIIETKKGDLWFAGLNSVDRFDRTIKKFEHHLHNPKGSASLHGVQIYEVFEDSKENLWVGTDYGLNLFQKSTNGFIFYTIENGLPDHSVKSIIEDDHGNLWLATNKGISCFINAINLPVKPKFKNYTPEDGLQGNEFIKRSCLKSADGSIYFGGINGFNVFNPDSVKDNPYIPEVVVTNFLIFNKPVGVGSEGTPLKQNITLTHELTLSYSHSVFSFIYAALNYVSSQKNQYAYKMEGFEKEWNYVGSKREATYTNLNPGEYTFRVKASNNDGIWNEKGTSIKIIILPPWWQTWWFRILVIFVILYSVISYFNYRTHRLRKQKILLAKMVKERTSQLEEVNAALEEKQEEIFIQNEELQAQKETLLETNTTLEEQKEEIESQKNELDQYRNHLEQLVKERTADLVAALEKVEESDRLKSVFLSNMSHEIRTPMNAIVGFSSLLNNPDLSSKDKETLTSYIKKSSEALLVLINDILEMSQIQANQVVIRNQPVNIIEIMRELFASFQLQAQPKGIDLIIETGTFGNNLICLIDPFRLKQVLSNLISNALKFTEKGSVKFGITIQAQGFITFYVKDTGIGIPKEVGNSIFERFLKVESPKTKLYEGVGLGLSISYSLVKAMGGNIWYESDFGQGTTFYFTIPSNYNEYNAEPKTKDSHEIPDLSNKQILIVEDEELNYRLIEFFLAKTNAKLTWAKNGLEALENVKNNNNIDLILMDLKMSVMDGIEATKLIRQIKPGQLIVAQTAFAYKEEKTEFLKSEFDGYIVKPLVIEKLMAIINEVFSK